MADQVAGWLPERVAAAERAAGTTFDLAACVAEPIHRLGGIQSYGALVAVRAGTIAVVSANASAVLGVPDLLDAPIDRLLGAGQLATLRGLADADTGQTAMMPIELSRPDGVRRFDVTVHRSDDLLVLEFEPASAAQDFAAFYAPVRQALVRLQQAVTVADACRAAVREIRAITGYDRVVAYRFESADGPGEVIAEEVADDWEPWLGLWFPATDVPPQARRLYERNWIRVIADVDDATARLIPADPPLDLSLSVLRTVSPFHLEYLRNIEVTASMSVSLLDGGRLWGLIACHGREVTALSPQTRAACEFFGVALSLHLAALRERDEASARDGSRALIARLLERVSAATTVPWPRLTAELDRVIDGDTVLVRTGTEVTVHGSEPEPDVLTGLLAALPAGGGLWHSDRLAEDLPGVPTGRYAGALVLPAGAGGDVIVWLRGERATERRWAADPDRPVLLGPHGRRLTPRGSTAVFQASVRGRSMPWSTTDLVMAAELGRAITGIALAYAQRLSVLNTELNRSNLDLDSFAHAAAHDLKEPLRGIANTATFISEDAADDLDPQTRRRLDAIQRLATRMDELLNALLFYSRVGRTDPDREPVDLRDAVAKAMEVAGPRLGDAGVEVTLPPAGTTLRADPVMLDQVLVNLLVNAAKYTHPERAGRVTVELDGAILTVRDNGIGMPEHLREQAFHLFRRLHPAAGRDGSGAGLAIVRRIVERHGGRCWAEETAGGGTTIRATFSDATASSRGSD